MLIRMLSNIKNWDGSMTLNRPDAFICSDTIAELRSKDNRLSVWLANSQDDVEDALVALALNRENVNKINYCLLEDKSLEELGIAVASDQSGLAPGLDDQIRSKHRDLIDMDFWRIGFLAEHMLEKLKKADNQKFLTKAEVKKLLNKYKDADKIEISAVKDSLKKSLKWE